MKKIIVTFVLLYVFCITSCATTLLTFLLHDTLNEETELEKKLVMTLENKTDEILTIFLVEELFPGNKKLWAQIARIPPHNSKEVKVTQGKTIRIIGGNTRIEYMDIECIYEDFITVYPQKNIPYVPDNSSRPTI
jgi:hypothetical protein